MLGAAELPPPPHAASIVAHQQRAIRRDQHIDRASARIIRVSGEEATQHVNRLAVQRGAAVLLERHEHDLISGFWGAVPAAMQAYKRAAFKRWTQLCSGREGETQWRDMVAQREIRPFGIFADFRAAGLYAPVLIAAPVVPRRVIEATEFHTGEEIRHEIGP